MVMQALRRVIDCLRCAAVIALGATTACAYGQAVEPVWSLAQKEKPALLDTLKELVSIESGSRDLEVLGKIAACVSQRLTTLGSTVERLELCTDLARFTATP